MRKFRLLSTIIVPLLLLLTANSAQAATLCRVYHEAGGAPSIRYEAFGEFYDYGNYTDPVRICVRVKFVSVYYGQATVSNIRYERGTDGYDFQTWSSFNINAGSPGPWYCKTITTTNRWDTDKPRFVLNVRQNVIGATTITLSRYMYR